MSVSKTIQSESTNTEKMDAGHLSEHEKWMKLRHPFFAGRLGYFGNTAWTLELTNKKRMKFRGVTVETLYYISRSDGIFQPVLRGFLKSLNSLLKRGIIEPATCGWTLTELGKIVVESFEGTDLFPEK